MKEDNDEKAIKKHSNKMKQHRKKTFQTPQVSQAMEVLLETNLLAGSIMYSSWVEIAGQGMTGLYFENGDIVTDENYWGD